ncbi:MAG: CAP domain-containing protein [bacterium]
MLKIFHTFLIPYSENQHKPKILRHYSLFAIAIGLLILQLVFHIFGWDVSRVGASTTITSSEIIHLTNIERSKRNLPQLSYSSNLTVAARNKGAHMLQYDYWSHTAPDGTTPWYWILNSGYNYLYAGENLAKDFVDTNSVIAAWMASTTHRNNLLSNNFRDMGVAVIEGKLEGKSTILVIQMFGQNKSLTRSTPNTTPNIESNITDTTPPETPSITLPKHQSYINQSRPEIIGESEIASTVTVYDAQNKLGSVPTDIEGAYSFRPNNELVDGEHGLSVQARDIAGNSSDRCSTVIVNIDTVPPKLINDSLKVDAKKDNLGEHFEIMIQLEEQTDTVLVNVGDYSAVLEPSQCDIETANKNKVFAQAESCNIYFGDILPPAKTLLKNNRGAEIIALDKAGNTDSYKFDLPKSNSTTFSLSSSSFIQNLLQNPPSTLINTILAILVLGFFVIDSIIIYRKNVLRKNSHSSAQTLILILGIMTMLFLQNGNII